MQSNLKIKNIILGLAKATFAIGLLYWLYQKGVLDLNVIRLLFKPKLIITSILMLTISFFIATWRWKLLLRVQNLNLTLWECFKLNLIGLFFNYVMPGGVGGDVVKGFYIVKDHPKNRMGAGMSVLLDRVMGLYAMLFLSLVSLLFNIEEISKSSQLFLITKGLIVGFIVFTSGLILAFSPKFRNWGWQSLINKFSLGQKLISAYESVYSYSHNLKIIAGTIFLSLVAQIFAILLFWWMGQNIGFQDIDISTYFSVVPIGFMVTAVPISPAGVGVGQMAFFFLFNLFLGKESQVGPAVITAFQVLNFLLGLFGVWFFIQKKNPLTEVEGCIGS